MSGRFDALVADCPLHYTSPNAPSKRDVPGTVLLSILAGQSRYAHITALRGDGVNPALLGMGKVASEDSVRRGLERIGVEDGTRWLQGHLDDTVRPLLSEPWVLDCDTTIEPLYGRQEGAVVSYNTPLHPTGWTLICDGVSVTAITKPSSSTAPANPSKPTTGASTENRQADLVDQMAALLADLQQGQPGSGMR